jgi:molybdate transport repressor ModE-like protein
MSGKTRAGWHGVELRHLAALQAVGRECSFSAAASTLGYTQSAISGQIRALERVVGARLVERVRGSRLVRLTHEGEILVTHATAIAARLDAAQSDFSTLRSGSDPVLRVGTLQSLSFRIVAEAVRRLSTEEEDAEVVLKGCHEPAELLDLLERGDLDLAFALSPVRAGVLTTHLYRDEYVAILRRSDPLASRRCVTLEELATVRMIALGRQPFGPTGMRVDDAASLAALVSAGVGVGIAPAHALTLPSDLTVLELEGGPPAHSVAIAWHRDRLPNLRARRFVELAVRAAACLTERPMLRAM